MPLSLSQAPGGGLFKPGYQSHDSEDGAIIRNIEACRATSSSVQTSLGPHGRSKIVINHLQKMTLTSDAATILRELEVVHPAAKLLVMASHQQDSEIGDGTNFVVILAGELLKQAELLLRMGLKASEIIYGYEKAQNHVLSTLEELSTNSVEDLRSSAQLTKALKPVVASKKYGQEDILAPLIAEAVLEVLPKNINNFNVDNIRVVKILGRSLAQSSVVKGMVFNREPEGVVKSYKKAKVAVFTCAIDIGHTETKGTVLFHRAEEMLNFTKGEEKQVEQIIKEIHDSGVRVIVAGSTVSEMAIHFINQFEMVLIKVLSKFELRRLARVVGAAPLARLGAPMPDEMGAIDVVETTEIGGDRMTVFRQTEDSTGTATIVLRGATQNMLDDVERAVDDAVNAVKAFVRDTRLVPGAGATEISLAERTLAYADRTPGIAQYALRNYAHAFEVIPRTLADSAGLDATDVVSRLYSAHSGGKVEGGATSTGAAAAAAAVAGAGAPSNASATSFSGATIGVDIENKNGTGILDSVSAGILDSLACKRLAIKLATEVAMTILSVDQIIVARAAGGPKPPGPNPLWDDDD